MRQRIRGVALAVAVGGTGLVGCSGSTGTVQARMRVSPKTAVADVPVSVSLSGLPAGKTVTVTSTATDDRGVHWKGSATFTVPRDGTLTLGAPSTAGSYTGRDPMGLFEYMAPPKGSKESAFTTFFDGKPFTVKLTASVDGRTAATSTVRRLGAAPGVTHRDLRPATNGVYGQLYLPPHSAATPHPGLLLFGGSEGGLSTAAQAARIASHGYAVLALAYFDEPGLPKRLRDIPLEYFARAARVLRAQPGVDADHVLAMGISRGSEAALLLGAHFPQLVSGVIAGSPSSVVNPSTGGHGSAWTLHGKALPHVPPSKFGAPDPAGAQDAAIPVQNIRGPVLLICGTQDDVWSSCDYQAAIRKRLRDRHFGYRVSAVTARGAGHFVGSAEAYFSATEGLYVRPSTGPGGVHSVTWGGQLVANKRGEANAHSALLRFLAAQH